MSSETTHPSWSVEPPFPPQRLSDSSEISLRRWALEYGVISDLLPFEFRNVDPIEAARAIREYIADAPPTKATISTSEIADVAGLSHSLNFRDIVRVTGCWVHSDGSHHTSRSVSATRWVNPQYVHATSLEPSITEPRYRIEELRRAASLGILSQTDIAPRFGVSDRDSVHKFCEYWDVRWAEWRQWGKRRLARSLRTAYEWTDHSLGSIADAVGLPNSTLREWLFEYYAPDFEPPADPSFEPWFGVAATGGE